MIFFAILDQLEDKERACEEKINGYDGQLYLYTNGCFELMWIDDEYLYTITSTVDGVTKEDIMKMAESVK